MKISRFLSSSFKPLVLGFLFSVACVSSRAAEPIRALLLTGGCCHDYGEQQKILTEGISARANVVWTILYEGGSSKGGVIRDHRMSIYEKPDWTKGYDVIVHNECFGDVTNAEFIDHIAKGHFDGVPAVTIHCSTHSYRKSTTDEWRKLLGVSSYNHEGARPFDVVNIKPDHPVMKGFPALWHEPEPDELYRIKKVWPNCTPLAKGIGKTGEEHPCIWVNTYGKARVFGTTLGHGDVTMASDVYLDLLTRGLLWACNDLDDNGQPKEGYGKPAAQVSH
ncbi:MAG TPA: ThuA domain-containing protein [Candidatus Saccharimonadales bacterium]|nr:ThuA domain-containing protein [Candidatus Saccharimonadales bacterium]